ncbi:MAG: 5-oxoprolinase subunit PxpA [Candidatus Aerophobetes bacterium]|nr:5-oxoprolinase subunit PxpA [Candidatus Aerophobetes bacterium]
MKRIDLNCDMGESFGHYKIGLDDEIIKYITSANIGCGFHGGDPMVMRKTVKIARENGAGIGAHPGFPDLMGFGRRKMDVTPEEIKNYVLYQIGSLYAFAKAEGGELQHIKPHGALYNTMANDERLSRAVMEGIADFDKELIVLGLAGSKVIDIAEEMGLKVASEAFADRAYNPDGTLVSRRLPKAVITNPQKVLSRVIQMVKEEKIECINGEIIERKIDTICVHGDSPGAVELVKLIKQGLKKEEIALLPMKRFL